MMVHACKFTTRDIETEESQVQNHLGDLVSSRPTWDGFDPSSKKKKKKSKTKCKQSANIGHLIKWYDTAYLGVSPRSNLRPSHPGSQGKSSQLQPFLSLPVQDTRQLRCLHHSFPRHRNRLRHRLLTKRQADLDTVKSPASSLSARAN